MSIAFERPAYLILLLLLPLNAWVSWRHLGSMGQGRHRFALAARLLLLSCCILALAGLQGVRRSDELTVVFLLDRSESISSEEQETAEEWVRQALAGMPSSDRAAVVAFGGDVLVERIPSSDRSLAPVASVPIPDGSDIAGAIHMGMALLPEDTAGRLILLSDGQETTGDARAATRLATARDTALDIVPIGRPPLGGEVRIAELLAPTSARQGQILELSVAVESTAPTEALLEVISEGQLLEQRGVTLAPGMNRFLFSLQAGEPGFYRHEAYIRPIGDTWPQNNLGGAFTIVLGPPRLLLVEGAPGEAAELLLALQAADFLVDIVPPARLPPTPKALATYDALFLVDTPSWELPAGSMTLLRSFVRDLGRGLTMVGGPASFGRGGYLRTPVEDLLPVELRPRDRAQRPALALVLVLDRSGSMAQGGSSSGSPSKLELAVEAAFQAAQAMEEGDLLGVVAFDTAARWVVPLEPVDADAAAQALAGLSSGGGTSIYAGLTAARDAILEADSPLRHVILLSDGWSEGMGYADIVEEMAQASVSTSIIAIGEEPAEYLQGLAEVGGGRYFWVRRPEEIPQVLLDETMTAMGAYIIEEPFYPVPGEASPILANLAAEALPLLQGYNGSWPKQAAQVPLYTHLGDPLLAHWNYGLGRAVAWTSDLKGQWAAEWVVWEEFPRFAAQLTGWMLPLPEEGQLQVETTLEGRHMRLEVVSRDEQGRPEDFMSGEAHLIGPNLEALTATLSQVAPGRYRTQVDLPAMGAYLMQIQLSTPDGQIYRRQGGVVVPYSAEYRTIAPDPSLLDELAHLGKGAQLSDPGAVFRHTLPPARVVRDWGPALLFIAVILLPLDVASRRLRLPWKEVGPFLRQLGDLARRRPASPQPALPEPLTRTLQRVRQARQSRQKVSRPERQPIRQEPPPRTTPTAEPPQPTQPAPTPADTLSRLRRAKDRARRRDDEKT